MATNIITLEDLQQFRQDLLADMKKLLSEKPQTVTHRWLKSHQVRRLLMLSPGTLQHLRVNGTLPYSKVGGVLFYDAQDIERILQERKQNTLPNAHQ